MSKKWWLVPLVAFAVVVATLFAMVGLPFGGVTDFDARLEYMTDNAQVILQDYSCAFTLNEETSVDNNNYIKYTFEIEGARLYRQYAQVNKWSVNTNQNAEYRPYQMNFDYEKISDEIRIDKYSNSASQYQYWFYYSYENRGVIGMDIMLNDIVQHSIALNKVYTNVSSIICIGYDCGVFMLDNNAIWIDATSGKYRWFDKDESTIIRGAGNYDHNLFMKGGVLLAMESDNMVKHNSIWHGEVYKSNGNYYKLYINMFSMNGGREIAKLTIDLGENKFFYKTSCARVA